MRIWVLVALIGCCSLSPVAAQEQKPFRVVWALGMERDPFEQQKEMIVLAARIGFDAIAVRNPSPEVVDVGLIILATRWAIVDPLARSICRFFIGIDVISENSLRNLSAKRR